MRGMTCPTINQAGLKIPRRVWMFVRRPCGKFNRDIIPAAADDGNTPCHTTRHHNVALAYPQNEYGFSLLLTQPTPKFSLITCQHHAPFPRWSVSAARRVRVVGLVGHGAEGSPSVRLLRHLELRSYENACCHLSQRR